jgi:hypothetical protein
MHPFARYVSFTLLRDASFVAVAGVTLLIAFSFDPPLAFKIDGYLALGFALFLLARALVLTEDRMKQSEPWRSIEPKERPDGPQGVTWARERMEETLLRFARNSSGFACALFGTALVISMI